MLNTVVNTYKGCSVQFDFQKFPFVVGHAKDTLIVPVDYQV